MRTAPLLAATVATTCLAAVALRGPARPAYDGPVALAAPPAAAAGVDWAAVVSGLDVARAAAFADPAGADPSAWAARSCACFAEDRRRLVALAAAGRGLDVGTGVVSDAVASVVGDRATVTFTDRLAPYTEVDGAGRVVRAWPGRGERRWRGVLVLVDGAWRWRELAVVADDHDPARSVDPRGVG